LKTVGQCRVSDNDGKTYQQPVPVRANWIASPPKYAKLLEGKSIDFARVNFNDRQLNFL
jgi:hypothetical protein